MRPAHLYFHIPFCARRCSYCDFAIAVRRNVPVQEYLDGVRRELDLRFPGDGDWTARTVYLGGGTPSRLGAEGIVQLMQIIHDRVGADGAEVTIEANPDDVDADAARAWLGAGINRVSLGAQSFDDRALKWMHRVHDATAIPRAFATLRDAGFGDISLDLIFSLPEELERDWRHDLDRAVALQPEHVSLYGLTIEAHAPVGRWVARGDTIEAPEERFEEEFLLAHHQLLHAGFEHYEVSNFGKPNHRARHNFAYWQGVPYAGIGPGAHEFSPPLRRWNVGVYTEWVRRLERGVDPVEGSEILTAENSLAEAVYLGLRTVEGLRVNDAEAAHVQPWVRAGWAHVRADNVLVLSVDGWLRLDSLAADLTLFRSR
jgi:putative oxygen-independent coproporphyrinogen III oxidase